MVPRFFPSAAFCAAALILHPACMQGQKLAADGAPQTFHYLADHFFSDMYFKYSPTSGTAAGLHQYDTQLEDYAPATIQAEIAALHSYEKKLAAIDPSALDGSVAGDHDILLANIRSELLSLETIRGWEKNPDNYSSGITNSAFVIMERPYAPANTRLRALVEREKLMPKVLDEGRRNLKNPPKIFTEIALEQIDGDVSFFEHDVPSAFFSGADGAEVAADPAAEGGVREDQCGSDCGAQELCRMDEVRPAASLNRRLPPWRRYVRKEAELRRDG